MRITNNMMIKNTSNNINGNKVNVDAMNNQMSSQKKIQRPSEDPVIAMRALRLRTSLSEIGQYYEKNIPDAESWMEVTQTAIENMRKILTDIRTQCTYGATDALNQGDRESILTQLEKLREQVYSEGNADYAGRTVFTGYRTNQKLTFMENEPNTAYRISQNFQYSDIKEHRYYGNEVKVPTTADEVKNNDPQNPNEAVFNRIRLGYGGIDGVPTIVTNPAKNITTTSYKNYTEWAAANANGEYEVKDGEAVFIEESGELIFSQKLADELRTDKAEINISYDKRGFGKGEVRPEYYYNCQDTTDPANPVDYQKFDANGKEIYQNIDYIVSGNQKLTVNTSASHVFDSSIGRDVDELIESVERAMAAAKKVEDLEAMKKMDEYASDECQVALDKWIEAAKKESDYANSDMQKLYNSYIGNCDKYLEKVNLALTDVGSKGVSLDLIKNRMSTQQTTIETLKSTNEDRELSDIIIDYTSAYTAYETSLQAAAKITRNTLLNYL